MKANKENCENGNIINGNQCQVLSASGQSFNSAANRFHLKDGHQDADI